MEPTSDAVGATRIVRFSVFTPHSSAMYCATFSVGSLLLSKVITAMSESSV